jgi:tRNA 2-thiocytidine biosynthesis protein TtcA
MVIRLLAYCAEQDIAAFSQQLQLPTIPCNLCGSQEYLQRKVIKGMLQYWQKRFPGRIEFMSNALQNVVPSHLADTSWFDFVALKTQSTLENGDISFDPPELTSSATTLFKEVTTLNITNILD